MTVRGRKTRWTWKWAGLLLVLGTALFAHAEPPTPKLPGRKPNSAEPWGLFLGRTAHEVIGRQYQLEHPRNKVFLDPATLQNIMKTGRLGEPKRLSEFARLLRPDITDTDAFVLFEIKPDNEEGLRQAREQAGRYLSALNEAVEPAKKLRPGTGFQGSLFLEFEDGGALWQLTWRTPEPGVTLYRWSYRRKRPGSSWKERAAQPEEAFPEGEIEKFGELAGHAVRGAYERAEWPADFRGQVYLPVDCH